MQDEILRRLDAIEREEDVRIIFACESGSRAWGFPSVDSDYDVRFIYVRPRDWYLSIEPGRDVIERPIVGQIDLSGWDLRKALRLFRRSNPPLMEWLVAPIVYRERGRVPETLRGLREGAYSPKAAAHHYLNMAKRTYRRSVQGHGEVRLKSYFYVLRPILACRWIQGAGTPPPMEFRVLLDRILPSGPVRRAVEDLLSAKRQAEEHATAPVVPLLDGFMRQNIDELTEWAKTAPVARGVSLEELNRLFRRALAEGMESQA